MIMSADERLARIERLILIQSKEALTVSEVALMLGLSESRVRHLTSEKALPYYKQGKNTYFKKSEIEDWMLQDRVPTNQEIKALATTHVVINHPKF